MKRFFQDYWEKSLKKLPPKIAQELREFLRKNPIPQGWWIGGLERFDLIGFFFPPEITCTSIKFPFKGTVIKVRNGVFAVQNGGKSSVPGFFWSLHQNLGGKIFLGETVIVEEVDIHSVRLETKIKDLKRTILSGEKPPEYSLDGKIVVKETLVPAVERLRKIQGQMREASQEENLSSLEELIPLWRESFSQIHHLRVRKCGLQAQDRMPPPKGKRWIFHPDFVSRMEKQLGLNPSPSPPQATTKKLNYYLCLNNLEEKTPGFLLRVLKILSPYLSSPNDQERKEAKELAFRIWTIADSKKEDSWQVLREKVGEMKIS